MNTSTYQNDNLGVAENYYCEMLAKNFDAMAMHLHQSVKLISPLAEISGKTNVVDAAKNLRKILTHIDIRAKLCSDSQVMLAYDFFFPEPIGKLRSAVLMEFKDGLISRIELFYDGRPFNEIKNGIFSK